MVYVLSSWQSNCESSTSPHRTASIKPHPHQQQRRSNIVECYKSNDSFDGVECCFDIVAVFSNSVERNKSKQIDYVQFVSLSYKRTTLRGSIRWLVGRGIRGISSTLLPNFSRTDFTEYHPDRFF